MAVWVVRGAHREEEVLEEGLISIGYSIEEDLASFSSREDLKRRLRQNCNTATPNKINYYAGRLLCFRDEIKVDDMIVMPRQGQHTVAIGNVASGYVYVPSRLELCHGRRVSWIDKEVSKTRLGQALYEALSHRLGVYQPSPTNAEERLILKLFGGA